MCYPLLNPRYNVNTQTIDWGYFYAKETEFPNVYDEGKR